MKSLRKLLKERDSILEEMSSLDFQINECEIENSFVLQERAKLDQKLTKLKDKLKLSLKVELENLV